MILRVSDWPITLVSPGGEEREVQDRSSSDALLSVKRESIFPRCDADDPIVVSDDETREEPSQVSKQVSKGNKEPRERVGIFRGCEIGDVLR